MSVERNPCWGFLESKRQCFFLFVCLLWFLKWRCVFSEKIHTGFILQFKDHLPVAASWPYQRKPHKRVCLCTWEKSIVQWFSIFFFLSEPLLIIRCLDLCCVCYSCVLFSTNLSLYISNAGYWHVLWVQYDAIKGSLNGAGCTRHLCKASQTPIWWAVLQTHISWWILPPRGCL